MKFLIVLLFTFSVSAQTNQPAAIPVTTKPLAAVLIEQRLSANAQVVAKNAAQIAAEVTATVANINVDIGDAVKQGDLLVQLDVTDWQLQLDQAVANTAATQARLKQAQVRLDRAKELETSQYISADDLLARDTDVAVLKADLMRFKVAEKTARRQLEKTTITAPFDGVVSARQAQLGQLMAVGGPVVSLVQTTDAEIHAKIPSHLANQLSRASRMELVTQNASYPTTLIQLTPVVETQAAMQNARFRASEGAPLVGQTGQLVWYLSGRSLSADLITKRAGQLGVFVAENNQAKFIPLPGAQEGRPVAIEANHNWQVIVGGRERLQDGDLISVR
ncbi:efflux RND transporter periplasmic adaptor subunit [Marinicella sp. S1101]|uniref:efflux RND transporter periplasmic adaptor subunit n=1 Tax=Marinicella marina TaxID=2996016 RepID=UPI002260B1BD|nr:efflux RND transporter periplasmic adaptor subunit [Marinicella marina]MCX7553361.1 efflux RND transporter periplasmic adaptor subunit [Marinicella marina]MDJ1139093.1 efflux RND transporter periplasmic adaptor subunit [Marinicella marina]